MKMAVHFGAGNIGRGFIGLLLADAGFNVNFVDVNATLINALHRDKRYYVHIVGTKETRVEVNNVDGFLSTDAHVATLIAKAEILTCAVGASILDKIALSITAGLKARREARNTAPLYIIACENMIRATSALKAHVLQSCDSDLKDFIAQHVQFLDCAVDRIVPVTEQRANPLDVVVEDFFEWVIERHNSSADNANSGNATADNTGTDNTPSAPFPGIEGALIVDDLMPFIERKLFTLNTAHAFVAWQGALLGHDTIDQCMGIPEIYTHTEAICNETGAVLIQKHGFKAAAHQAYIQKVLKRFENPYLKDDVMRVGRSPIRKLSANERIVAPLKDALALGLPHTELVYAAALGLCFDAPDDTESQSIQQRLQTHTPEAVFMQLSELDNPAVADAVATQYRALKKQS